MRKNFLKVTGTILLGGASLIALVPGTAWAAEPGDPAAQQDDDIIVTGSRVRGVAPVGSIVTTLDRTAIEESGTVTVDRMIKELPQVFDLGVSENSRGQAGGNGNIVYGNSINLRGIGPYSTLILIDGHRVVNNSRSIDPSVIPTLGLERVEVIADGASAIYGSDAVAGVVNLIPRRSLDGVDAFARAGFADNFHEYSMGVALGKVFDRGQIMVAYEHAKRSNLSGDDRAFFTSNQVPFGGKDYRTTSCSPGTLTAGGVTYAMPAQLTQANAGSLVPGTTNLCDTNVGQDLFPEQEYDSVNATGTFDITDWLTVFADGFYSKRKFSRNSGFATARLTVPETNAFFVRPAGFTGTSYTIDYNFLNDLPLSRSFGSAESWQITPGLRFNLPYDWEFEALAGFGKTKDISESYDGLDSRGDLPAALASSDPNVAFDPYGLGRTSASTLSAIADQIFIAPTNGKLTNYEARLNGPLFELPGGTVKLAAGYERQEFEVDLGTARGNPGAPMDWRHFERDVDSVYAEVVVPFFGPGNATPGFERLELNAAVRYDKYSDAGSTTNPKFGVNWVPFEGLKLRGSYSTSFRAPTIPEIYGNSTALYGQLYQNPAGGAQVLGYAFGSGPNLDLGPETAENWSIGADIDLVNNLRVSLTYWNIVYEDQIAANLSNLTILGQEDQYAGTGVILRDQAARDRVQELLNQGITVRGIPIPGGDIANVNLYVDGRGLNLGKSITRGIDFDVLYAAELGPNDNLTLNASGTYLTSYKVAISQSGTLVDQRNIIFQPLKFKARASATWDHGPISTRLQLTHVGGYTNNLVTPSESVDSYTPVDLSVSWRVAETFDMKWADRLVITGEVRNVFDTDPPYVNLAPGGNGSGGYDATASNPIGRMFAIGVRTSF